MSTRRPPRLGSWLLARCFDPEHREALIGDLAEQHHAGKSAAWYWRQTAAALAAHASAAIRTEPWLAFRALAVSACLMLASHTLFMAPRTIEVRVALNGWYRSLISGLLAMQWDSARHAVYHLHVGAWTDALLFCGNLAGIAWGACRLHPRHRHIIIVAMVASEASLCLHYLQMATANWMHDPGNPLWIFNLFWFVLFTFVAIPASIVSGGRWAMRRCAATFAVR
jgi:hypothetical protein